MGKMGAPYKQPPVPNFVWLEQRFRLQMLAARSKTAGLSTTAAPASAPAAPDIMRRAVSDPVVNKDSTLQVGELLFVLRSKQTRSKSCPPNVAGRAVHEVDV